MADLTRELENTQNNTQNNVDKLQVSKLYLEKHINHLTDFNSELKVYIIHYVEIEFTFLFFIYYT